MIRTQETKKRYAKPEAVKELERLANDEARQRHPSLRPDHIAPRKFRDDTTGGLTACITAYLKLKGAFCSRVNNQGVFDKRLNRYRPGTNRRGLPDVMATIAGESLMIEVKTGRDRMSEHQERIRDEQIKSGGLYYVAHDFTEFKQWLDKKIIKKGINTRVRA